jgi:N6-adenosine-specific RNA methylase IME4
MKILLSVIRLDGGTQPRAEIDQFTVDDYAEAMRGGAQLPPPIVFYDGTDYWLADGFHRVHAFKSNAVADVECDVRQGTRRDAVLFSVGANAAHGKRRTNADKRRAVMTLLGDGEWSGWSNAEIARRVAVSDQLVNNLRASLPTVGGEAPVERTFTTKHGTVSTMNTERIGRSPRLVDAPLALDAALPEPEAPVPSRPEPARIIASPAPVRPSPTQSLAPEVREVIRHLPMAEDRPQLERLAKLDPEEQRAVVELVQTGEARHVKDALRQIAHEGKRQVTFREAVQGRFAVVYADPPWAYNNSGFDGSPDDHYPTMPTDDICAMGVGERVTSNAVCFLWATNPLLEDAMRVMEAWGFAYKTNLCWVKDRDTYLGFYAVGQHELLLIGTKGSMVPLRDAIPKSVIHAPRTEHSRKPGMHDLIERMYPDGPYLEMFARRPAGPRWSVFGNEEATNAA